MGVYVTDTPADGVFDFEATEYLEASIEVTDDLGNGLMNTLVVRYPVGDTFFSDSTGAILPCAVRTGLCHWTPTHQAQPMGQEPRLFAMSPASDGSMALDVSWHAEAVDGEVLADGDGADIPLESLRTP